MYVMYVCNHASASVFTGFDPPVTFFLLKTEDTDERKAFCYVCGDKKKIEAEAVGDPKNPFSEMFRGLEKMLALVYYIWEGVTFWKKKNWKYRIFLITARIYRLYSDLSTTLQNLFSIKKYFFNPAYKLVAAFAKSVSNNALFF